MTKNAIFSAVKQTPNTRELQGRSFGMKLGVVSVRNPDNRTIRVRSAANPNQDSPDLYRCVPSSAIEYSLPQLGETVVFAYVDGNPNVGVFFGVVENNAQRPATDEFVKVRAELVQTQSDDIITQTETLAIQSQQEATLNNKGVMVIGGQDNQGHVMVSTGQ